MQIYEGKIDYGQIAQKANGGTEMMMRGVVATVPPKLLKDFQIVVSRMENDLDEKKIRIYWAHDLPGDPAANHLANGGYAKFHRIVFPSNWSMQQYIQSYKIPWSHCIVLQNAINPIEYKKRANDKIKLIYHTTPHRGLNILVPVFEQLCKKHDNIELEVYSSFELYGWTERDKEFEPLFKQCEDHPKINYHKTVDNKTVREALQQAHIFAYPSVWPETSCLCLMEAMSAGLMCVHSNYGALAETAANWTHMYHFNENLQDHANVFHGVLGNAIDDVAAGRVELESRLLTTKNYADVFYNWTNRAAQWQAFLKMMQETVTDRKIQKVEETFVYKT